MLKDLTDLPVKTVSTYFSVIQVTLMLYNQQITDNLLNQKLK